MEKEILRHIAEVRNELVQFRANMQIVFRLP